MAMTLDDGRALVLFSGGQDSTVCLAWALSRFTHVETIGFAYGQRHHVELERRGVLRERLSALNGWRGRLGPDHVIALDALGAVSATALTSEAAIVMGNDGLPTTFVPGRNLLFFTFAAALAYRRAIRHVVGGMCETDYSGYPDCRDDTIKALQATLNLGMDARFVLHTPLMFIDKAATWAMTEDLGGGSLVEIVRVDTHSCYRGDRSRLHDWGYGCDDCPACALRKDGFARWRRARAASVRT